MINDIKERAWALSFSLKSINTSKVSVRSGV